MFANPFWFWKVNWLDGKNVYCEECQGRKRRRREEEKKRGEEEKRRRRKRGCKINSRRRNRRSIANFRFFPKSRIFLREKKKSFASFREFAYVKKKRKSVSDLWVAKVSLRRNRQSYANQENYSFVRLSRMHFQPVTKWNYLSFHPLDLTEFPWELSRFPS